MRLVADLLVAFVALEHVYILVLEMFLWETARGRKAFAMDAEKAATTAVMAKNQGLYNGFLAAGLVYGLVAADPIAFHFKVFFCACVAIAGIYGGATAFRKIFFLQGVPALSALLATVLVHTIA